MVWRVCEITLTLDFIFQLVLYSHENVLLNIICLNELEDIKQFYFLMWFKKKRLETPFKGDGVKALMKVSNCENLVLYFSEKVQKIGAIAMLVCFSVTKQSLEMVLASPDYQKYPHYPLVLKFNLSTAAVIGISVFFFKWKLLSDERHLYLHDSKWNLRYDVAGLIHTQQLFNLFCIE